MLMFFWVVMPCGLAGRDQCFGETYVSPECWYLPTNLHGITTQNNNINIIKKIKRPISLHITY
jgi:hypothetical protein